MAAKVKKAPKRVTEDPKYKERLETLAKLLHESGRKAVEQGKVFRSDLPIKPFAEWTEIDENTKEGRRMMAAFLLDGRRRSAMKALFR